MSGTTSCWSIVTIKPTVCPPHRDFRSVIRWHPPADVARTKRRGGYYPPGCFPSGETTSAQCADNAPPNICKRNSAVKCRNMVHFAILLHFGPIRFCSKICSVGGRILAAPTQTVPPNYRCKHFAAPGGLCPPLGSPSGRAGERTRDCEGVGSCKFGICTVTERATSTTFPKATTHNCVCGQ